MAPMVCGSAISRLSQAIMRQSIRDVTLDGNTAQRQDMSRFVLALGSVECQKQALDSKKIAYFTFFFL